jgi:hypothetical protein
MNEGKTISLGMLWPPARTVLIAGAAVYFISIRGEYTLIDNFDLIIHEAGHALLRIFGETIHMLGGTLMQIMIPSLLLIYAFKNRMTVFGQLTLLLLSQNFINISVYAADAQDRKLRLFGPPGAKHDWYFLLTKYDILEYHQDIAMGFVVCACLGVVFILLYPYIIKRI